MSTTIDRRVVKMEFDNSKFEANCQKAISALEVLKKALELKNVSKSAQASIGEVQRSMDRGIDTRGVEAGVSSLQSRFSTLGIVGMTAISNITNSLINLGKKLVSQAIQGGIRRALNIEQAKFMIEGLGKDYEKLSQDINYAVEDTAYGFDEAARAASQFSASGIEAGDDMKKALRGISGVAAMTGSSYEDIANIFTRVAGQGRLMGNDLLSLSARGINAAAILGEQMGKTESEIRDMVTKGKISFQDFAKAMDDAFGEHAKEANRTFTGSLSNIKAALSRIGAGFVTPIIETKDEFQSTVDTMKKLTGENEKSIETYLKNLEKQDKITRESLRELSKKGVPALQELSKYLGKTEDEILQMADSGDLKFKQLTAAMDYSFGKKNGVDVLNAFRNALNSLKKEMENVGIYEKWGKAVEKASEYLTIFFDSIAKARGLGFDNLLDLFSNLFKVDRSIIEDIFGGVSSALNIVKTAFKSLVDAVKPAGTTFTSVKDTIFSLLAAIGRFITKFDEMLQRTGAIQTLGNILHSAFSGASNIISSVFDSFRKGLDALRGGKDKVVEKTSAKLSKFLEVLDGFAGKMDRIKESLASAGKGIAAFFDAIGNAFTGGGAGGFISLVNGGALTAFLVAITGFIRKANWAFQGFNITKIGNAIADTAPTIKANLMRMGGAFEAFRMNFQASSILKIAIAIGILAVSLKLLSTIDGQSMGVAIIGLASAMGILVLTVKLLSDTLKKTSLRTVKKMDELAFSLILFAVAIGLLVKALVKLSDVEPDRLIPSLFALLTMMGSLAIVSNLMATESKGMIRTSVALTILGAALMIFASAIKKLGSLDLKTLGKGLGSVMLLLASFMAINIFTISSDEIVKSAIAMTILGGALLIMAKAVAKFGGMDLKQLGIGLGSVIAFLGAFVAMNKLMSKPADLIKTSAGIAIMAVSLLIIFKAVKKFGKLDLKTLAKGLGSVIALLGAFVAMNKLMSKPADLVRTGAGIAIMAGAIAILAPAIERLGKLSLQQIGLALLAIAGAFAIFGVAALVLKPVIPTMIALSGAIALFGAGIALAGVGVLAFATGLTALAASAGVLVASMSTIVLSIVTFVEELVSQLASRGPIIAKGIFQLIRDILQTMIDNLPELVAMGMTLILTLLETLKENIGQFVDIGADIVVGLINGLSERLPDLIDAGLKLIISLINGLAEAIRENGELIGEALWNLLESIIEGVFGILAGFFKKPFDYLSEGARMESDNILAMVDAKTAEGVDIVESYEGSYEDAGRGLTTSLNTGIKAGSENVPKNVNNAVSSGKKEIDNQKSDYKISGQNLMTGMSEGINQNAGKVLSSVTNAAKTALEKMKKELGIESPSKETMKVGRFFDMGFAIGVSKYSGLIENSVSDLSSDTMKSLNTSFATIADKIQNGGIDLQPTIRPVLDLSDVRTGAQTIGSILSGQTIALGGSLDNFANVNAAMNATNTLNNSQNQLLMEGQNKMVSTLDELLINSERSALDLDRVYDAIREGAENATIRLSLNGRELSRGLKELGVAFR